MSATNFTSGISFSPLTFGRAQMHFFFQIFMGFEIVNKPYSSDRIASMASATEKDHNICRSVTGAHHTSVPIVPDNRISSPGRRVSRGFPRPP